MDLDVFRLEVDRQSGAASQHGIDERGGNIHLRNGIAELVRLGLLQFDGAFADDRPLMPAGAGFL
jgi:hypothetical protein